MLWIEGTNNLSDIHAPGDLPNLYRVILTNCNVSDVSPLEKMTKLGMLRLDENQIIDLNSLKMKVLGILTLAKT